MLNLAIILEESARRMPGKTAVILDSIRLNYAELNGAANKIANGLANLGVRPGDKVAMMIPNTPHFPMCYFGILKAGATVVPLNVLFKRDEVRYHLEDSDSVALIVWEGFLDEAASGFHAVKTCRHLIVAQAPGSTATLPDGAIPLGSLLAEHAPVFDTVQTMPDDTAVILYTSGTTGRPKGAELTHANMFLNATICTDKLLNVSSETVGLAVLPLFHSFGQTCVMNSLIYAGGAITMLPRFEPQKALEVMARDRVTYFAGVPTMYFYLLNFPGADQYDLSALKFCVSGGAAMPVEVMHAFNRKYNVTILEGYGLSETSPVASFNHLDREPKPGSIGVPIWGIEMRVVDDQGREVPNGELGEIVIRGHNVMKGYYKRPDATADAIRNGWFHSGDIAYRDDDGFFFIKDRVKDMIIRGGFNVYPREIEEVLYGHPAIAEAAVIGVPDQALGEEVKAVVALKPGHTATETEIIEYCKERLAAYKYPRIVEIRETLPKTATGKILKRELRQIEVTA
ncbi:long-chain-fatty-acid--CoA ligase [Roseiflexus castenholzii]|jgi:long-chain acyl-CoA synthetase|uniref:AMP-dependent synthetase and ligase n=1 Tax=Roseiflexus castenholzii (strain DSM 13941 / HLO8) TaxID=383372 RepID=A7NP89_ROSCS|nr:long-chain fatty acid--CoA ligase [Roseiflexus castenholzii]ABU59385.1 AMP-dependent synthetase and ligase [Roseiflexus castenholzii DSM 13941]